MNKKIRTGGNDMSPQLLQQMGYDIPIVGRKRCQRVTTELVSSSNRERNVDIHRGTIINRTVHVRELISTR